MWVSEKGENLLIKMASEGVEWSDARISNTRAVNEEPMFGIFVHYSTRSIYGVSMNLFCWPPSVDIFNILPGFLWQPLLKEYLLAVQLTYWNYFYFNHIVMYYDDCFLFFFLPSMCFLLFFMVCVLRCFVCLVIVMSCTFDTTFKELVASSENLTVI